ncbi:MAG: molybdate ABC transporter substrate-binding protein [Bacteroidota bacterium]
MRQKAHILFILTCFSFCCLFKGCRNAESKKNSEIIVFAAASVHEIVHEIATLYKAKEDIDITINTASSGVLARQIQQGAHADIFISADKKWLDYLNKSTSTVDTNNSQLLVKNRLVLITPSNKKMNSFNIHSFENTLNTLQNSLVAIGNPKYVPAGKYAHEALFYYGIDMTKFSSKFILHKDVRSALMTVELGEADFGIVYKTDAIKSLHVNIQYCFPLHSHSDINYYIKTCVNNLFTNNFYEFILSDEVVPIWEKHGFIR